MDHIFHPNFSKFNTSIMCTVSSTLGDFDHVRWNLWWVAFSAIKNKYWKYRNRMDLCDTKVVQQLKLYLSMEIGFD